MFIKVALIVLSYLTLINIESHPSYIEPYNYCNGNYGKFYQTHNNNNNNNNNRLLKLLRTL